MTLRSRLNDWLFGQIDGKSLVFNDCREDPRVDRITLDIGSSDVILVITSAGCNALDYVLLGPEHVYAVDINPAKAKAGQSRLHFPAYISS